jgi:predicted Fe-Mo cluster-binding NifX family protein
VRKLVCGAVSAPVQDELDRRGIEVIGFVAGEVDDVLRALMTGRLPHPALAMPGCGRRRRRIRGGHKPTAGGHH